MDSQKLPIQKFQFRQLGNDNGNGATAGGGQFRPLPYKVLLSPKEVEQVIEKEEPKTPVFSEHDIMQSRNKGYEEGYAKGYSSAKSVETEIEKNIQASMADINLKLAAISEAIKTRNNQNIKELAGLVIRVANKIAGTAIQDNPYSEIENIVKQSLPILFDEPKIIIYVNPDLVQNLASRIKPLAKNEGFRNNLEIEGNASLSPGSCSIEWAGGGLKSHKEDMWQQVEKLCACL